MVCIPYISNTDNITTMKNKEHRRLWKILKNLRTCSKNLQTISVAFKEEIVQLEYTEERKRLVERKKLYSEFITKTNREIIKVKQEIRECQKKSFGS
jgi:hypothetical protein